MNRLLSVLPAALLACASAQLHERAHPVAPAARAATPLEEVVAALPGPPPPGSDDAKADLAIVLWMQRTRTAADAERARSEVVLTLDAFTSALGPGFDPVAHPRTRALLQDVRQRARPSVHAAKERFRRPRPYDADARVQPAVAREPSSAYPSGHATYGVVLARILAELAPERSAALREAGLLVGYHRVIGGVHYPSDVLGGQQLGDALADRILADPQLRRELEAVKRAEWR